MTKAELIDAMKDFPDDREVKIWMNITNYEDSGALVRIRSVFSENGRIYIDPDED